MIHETSPTTLLEMALQLLIEQDCELELPITLSRPTEVTEPPVIRISTATASEAFPGSGIFTAQVAITLETRMIDGADAHTSQAMQLLQTFYFDTDLATRLTDLVDDFHCYGAIQGNTTEQIEEEHKLFSTTFNYTFHIMPRGNS